MPTPPRYKAMFMQFMSYLDGIQYDKDHIFLQDRLILISDQDAGRYFKEKAYRMEDTAGNDCPSLCCSSTLEYIKKALSYSMHRLNMQWDYVCEQGNPAKSLLLTN